MKQPRFIPAGESQYYREGIHSPPPINAKIILRPVFRMEGYFLGGQFIAERDPQSIMTSPPKDQNDTLEYILEKLAVLENVVDGGRKTFAYLLITRMLC